MFKVLKTVPKNEILIFETCEIFENSRKNPKFGSGQSMGKNKKKIIQVSNMEFFSISSQFLTLENMVTTLSLNSSFSIFFLDLSLRSTIMSKAIQRGYSKDRISLYYYAVKNVIKTPLNNSYGSLRLLEYGRCCHTLNNSNTP